ncbi:hypothetical protein ACH5RR_015839 [Cinchona calisaya]|uniref:Inositol monophosphatase n=1 Tax=Cinchona calisaya TaxID=153742 RepID=A0ABD2ZXP7_9GENT
MCHVALGIVEAYWEYRLKPWDMAAGVLIVEEAGGTVSCMDGGKFSVFDRSVLVSNGVLHAKLDPLRVIVVKGGFCSRQLRPRLKLEEVSRLVIVEKVCEYIRYLDIYGKQGSCTAEGWNRDMFGVEARIG